MHEAAIKTKSFLKWAGNKFRCLDIILGNMPAGRRLVEPFTGSGALFMNAHYSDYLLAERNQDLIALFSCIQQEGLEFIAYCRQFFSGQFNTPESYYRLREEFNGCRRRKHRAALFLYLNRHGYNGLCRYNRRGFYNVPFGRYARPYFPLDEMLFFHGKSQGAVFFQGDFRKTFALCEAGDVIYCDPPYVPLSHSANFSAYTGLVFTEEDHRTLATLAKEAAQKGAIVLISNHDTAFTREQYQGSEMISFPVARTISCNGATRSPVQELLAIFR